MAIERIPDPYAQGGSFPGGRRRNAFPVGPLTAVLIGLCVAVAIFSKLGESEDLIEKLYITRDSASDSGTLLPEVASGQFWRLLTPIFLHFGLPHILFNMLWLKDLGTMIERLTSTGLLLGLVLVAGVLSNLGQFMAAGPFFGGMSGVVYALLGFVWMKSRFDPGSGFHLEKQTVIMMIGWFFLCMTPVVPHVANYAHGYGLAIGMAWGFISAKSRRPGPSYPRFGE